MDKSEKRWGKVGESGEKLLIAAKSWKKWGKVGKVGKHAF